VVVFSSAVIQSPLAAGPAFFGLGGSQAGIYDARATAISGDGTTVVGWGGDGTGHDVAFSWTLAEGMVNLGTIPGGGRFTVANDVSADGSVIVGNARFADPIGYAAVIWTAAAGHRVLSTSAPGFQVGEATAVSADGTVVVGAGTWNGNVLPAESFRWSASSGATPLGRIDDNPFGNRAFAVSGDGAVVVGSSGPSFPAEAFIWSEPGGIRSLGFTNPSAARAISSDGRYIIGADGRVGSMRWSARGGVTPLEGISPSAISDDGRTIVGSVRGAGDESSAVLWDEDSHVRLLEDILENDLGLELGGWRLLAATDVSADGTVIVGRGYNPGGRPESFVAIIPEPATVWLLIVATIGTVVISARRNHRKTSAVPSALDL